MAIRFMKTLNGNKHAKWNGNEVIRVKWDR